MMEDWLWGLSGGLLIGLAAALFLLVSGRIMGASGLLGGLVDGSAKADRGERIALIAGLILVPAVLAMAMGGSATLLTSNPVIIIAGGLLVGFGTRIANGCTSGHGVCGISRLNVRGIVATLIYIGAGAATVLIFKLMLGAI